MSGPDPRDPDPSAHYRAKFHSRQKALTGILVSLASILAFLAARAPEILTVLEAAPCRAAPETPTSIP